MNKWKINSIQLASIYFLFIVANDAGISIILSLKGSGQNSYLCPIISFILGLIPLSITLYISNYKKNLTLKEKINSLFPKGINNIINVILTILFSTIGIITLFNMANFVESEFLAETPLFIITFMMTICLIYCLNKGIETISRVSLIFAIIVLIFHFITIAPLQTQVEFNNFLPFLDKGIVPIIKDSISVTLINLIPNFLLLIIPKNNIIDKEKTSKYIIISYILAYLLFLLMIYVIIGVLGPYVARIYHHPEYMLLKRISLFNFLDRIENIIAIEWLLMTFITIIMVIYYICCNTNTKPNLITNIIITSIIGLISTYIFKNNTVFYTFLYNYYPYILSIIFIIMIIIAITIFIKKKKE